MSYFNGMEKIKFDKNYSTEFIVSLRREVHKYFEDNKISRFGSLNMFFRTFVMLSLFFTPYFLIISGKFSFGFELWFLWTIMGVGLAGIGLSIMHDGNHGAFAESRILNRLAGWTLDLISASAFTWEVQHVLGWVFVSLYLLKQPQIQEQS